MATSIYGFAQSVQSSGSAVSDAIKLYNRAVKQATGETGYIENPDIFRQARETYLEPFADDVRASTKIYESMNEENRLRDKISDAQLASSVVEADVNDVLRDYQKAFYQAPDQLINVTAYVFGKTVEKLEDEIYQRRATGQSVGGLQELLNKYSEKERTTVRLARDMMMGGIKNPNAYGWFVRTNPNDGSIVSIEVDTSLATNRVGEFKRTDSYYSGIPVFTQTYQDQDGKEVARIGQNKFEFDSESKMLKRDISASTGARKGIFRGRLPGGETPAENKERIRNINLNSINFGDVFAAPKGSIAKDSRGNLYYNGGDGWYQAKDAKTLSSFLDMSGQKISEEQINGRAFPLSSEEVRGFGSFINEDGTSRIIDEKMLQGITVPAEQAPQSLLPQMNQNVSSVFKAAPAPVGANSMSTDAVAEVPRKNPGVRESIGLTTTKEFLKKTSKDLGQSFAPIAQSFKKVFRA